jgi:hypothetical protein
MFNGEQLYDGICVVVGIVFMLCGYIAVALTVIACSGGILFSILCTNLLKVYNWRVGNV